MIYIPTDLINEENYYSYNSDNEVITVYHSCVGDNCSCVDLYTNLDYQQSELYSCSLINTTLLNSIPTNNFYYRKDFALILIIFIIMVFIIIWCPIKILMRFFKRFN